MGICSYEIKRVHVEYESCLLRLNCKCTFKFLNTDISITSCNTNLNNYILRLIFFQFNTTKKHSHKEISEFKVLQK